jgi:hypothetical protein
VFFLYDAEVAQSVEQRTENPRVGSSILSLGTNKVFHEKRVGRYNGQPFFIL